jgi:CheY-like chemotaxis protein
MRRRILLADDSVTIQKVIELTFLDEDYEVKAVSNGDEAVAILSDVKPDFVIADVHMPGANGYEVCRRAKQLFPRVPVLLLVGTFEPFDEGQMRSAAADSYLKKPFDSQELLQRVEDLLATAAPAAPAGVEAPAFAEPSPAFAEAASALPSFDLPPLSTYEPSAFSTPEPPPLPQFSAQPEWGSLELEAEPVPSPFSMPDAANVADAADAADAAPEPFDREPSFELPTEPDPGFSFQPEEPVFAMDEAEVSYSLREEVSAPEELPLDEPFDRYAAEPAAPVEEAARPSAGFAWSTPAEEPAAAEPGLDAPLPSWSLSPEDGEATSPMPEPPPWSTAAVAEPWSAPEPEPWSAPASDASASDASASDASASDVPASDVPELAPAVAAPPPWSAPAAEASANGGGALSEEDVDRIARRVVELLGDHAVRDVAWEVIPDLAEVIIRDRLRELEGQADLQ